jgi:transcriptional regulator with XRE-family HTH domain
MGLGEYLSGLRRRSGLSQAAAAAKSDLGGFGGVSASSIGKMERGMVKQPHPNILRSLAEAYGVDYREVLVAAGHSPDAHTWIDEKRPGPVNLDAVVMWRLCTWPELLTADDLRKVWEWPSPMEDCLARLVADDFIRVEESGSITVAPEWKAVADECRASAPWLAKAAG